MYGFEAYRFNNKMEKLRKYHYFDDETGTTNVHSFVLLMKVEALWQLQDAGKLALIFMFLAPHVFK